MIERISPDRFREIEVRTEHSLSALRTELANLRAEPVPPEPSRAELSAWAREFHPYYEGVKNKARAIAELEALIAELERVRDG